MVKDQKKLVVRTPQQFKEMQDIEVKTEHRVTKIDPKEKKIEVVNLAQSETQWVPYNKLIIATGARSRRLNIPGNDSKNIFTLKDLQDGIHIKNYIKNYIDEKRPNQVAVLGGGFIGLAMCEAFRLRNCETFLFCRRDLPAGHLDREISEKILKELEENGVHFLDHQEPVAFRLNNNGEITSIETNKGQFPADMVLMAVGVIPNKVGYMPGAKRILIKLIFDRKNGRLLGAQMAGKEGVARRINALAVALHQKMTIDEIARLDFAYTPPFSAPFDPILIAAEQAVKKIIS